jgi:hypothetical protein
MSQARVVARSTDLFKPSRFCTCLVACEVGTLECTIEIAMGHFARAFVKTMPPCSIFGIAINTLDGLCKLLFDLFNLSLHPLRRSFRIEHSSALQMCSVEVQHLHVVLASTPVRQLSPRGITGVNSAMQTCHLRDKISLKRALAET